MTITISVDKATHDLLLELSKNNRTTLIDTVREAAEALQRVRFGQKVAGEYVELRSKPEEWQTYLQESDSTEVSDGIY